MENPWSHLQWTICRSHNKSYSKNSSAVKKGKAKKVQVTERLKDVISLWGQEEKLHQLGCVYKTSAYI